MLSKLLKYDLKYMIKNMLVFYILAIFFAVLSRLLSYDNAPMIVIILKHIFLGTMYSMMFSILFNTMIRSWVRFKDSIYKDESYLTHTLPVSKSDIYNSKLLQALIFFIVGFIVILISLFIALYTKENWLFIKSLINGITKGLHFNSTLFVITFLILCFLEVFNAIQCGFLGLILGHKKNNYKVAFSILFGFISYLIAQSLVLLLIYIVGLFDSSIMDLFRSEMLMNTNSLKLLFFIAIVLYIVIIIVMSIICKHELKKGVNIE